jgi:RNA polymerase sigma-70 factor, ECF subfamily
MSHNRKQCAKCRMGRQCPFRGSRIGGRPVVDSPELLLDIAAERRDSDAFGSLLEAERAYLQRNATSLTRNPTLAEDLVQETLMRAFTGRDTFERGSNLRAWLIRIQKNAYINSYHREMRNATAPFMQVANERLFESLAPDVNTPEMNPEQLMLDRQVDGRLLEVIKGLSDNMRTVFMMHCVDGQEYQEVARRLGISEGTVKSRVFRARETMREKLEHAGKMV